LPSRCRRARSRPSSPTTAYRIIREWPPRPGEIRSTPDVAAPLPFSATQSRGITMATACHRSSGRRNVTMPSPIMSPN
jgi:hypothetical protein